jgi:hypothetical protein
MVKPWSGLEPDKPAGSRTQRTVCSNRIEEDGLFGQDGRERGFLYLPFRSVPTELAIMNRAVSVDCHADQTLTR